MESIKETELNLQREVVTTVPNTWLVEAVNPSTGEKKMIDIANYASVVKGVEIKGIKENVDIDSFKTNAYYRIRPSSATSAVEQPFSSWYYLSVHKYTPDEVVQIATPISANGVKMRKYINSEWSNWQRIDNFGYNTLAELASGVAESLEIKTLKRRTKSGSCAQGTPLNFGAIQTAFVQIRYNYENKASLYFIASNNMAYKLCGNLSDGLSVSVNDNGELIVENTIGGSFWLSADILIL